MLSDQVGQDFGTAQAGFDTLDARREGRRPGSVRQCQRVSAVRQITQPQRGQSGQFGGETVARPAVPRYCERGKQAACGVSCLANFTADPVLTSFVLYKVKNSGPPDVHFSGQINSDLFQFHGRGA